MKEADKRDNERDNNDEGDNDKVKTEVDGGECWWWR